MEISKFSKKYFGYLKYIYELCIFKDTTIIFKTLRITVYLKIIFKFRGD